MIPVNENALGGNSNYSSNDRSIENRFIAIYFSLARVISQDREFLFNCNILKYIACFVRNAQKMFQVKVE